MSKPFRFASAASLFALASVIAGCAAPQNRVAMGASGKAKGEVGLATRALAALTANDISGAIDLAERAVEATPGDAGFRALLANAYFAGGRFASAEAAYKDSLSINPGQPQLVLKLALVEIGQGKHAEAVSLLETYRTHLDPADFGLALVLAGRAADAIPLLETAARVPNADGRVRQNLALAHAFTGDWEHARLIAAQDVPAGQLDARIQQWMQLAKPSKTSDQVAALTGVTPVVIDPGQPVRLALRQPESRMAEAAPALTPSPQFAYAEPPAPAPEVAHYVPPPPPPIVDATSAPQPQFAEAAPPPPPAAPEPAPVVAEAPAPVPPPSVIAMMASAAPEAPAAFAALASKVDAPKPAKMHKASLTTKLPPVRNATLRTGKSTAVVQLGAYGSRARVAAAWDMLTKRYPALRSYAPVTARFDSSRGTVYRLSVKGFDSQREAIARCNLLKSRGGNCFVRNVAGDAPIQLASR